MNGWLTQVWTFFWDFKAFAEDRFASNTKSNAESRIPLIRILAKARGEHLSGQKGK